MTRNGFRSFFIIPRTWKARLGLFFGGLCVLTACGLIRYCWGTSAAKAEADPAPATTGAAPAAAARSFSGIALPPTSPEISASALIGRHAPIPPVVATVNSHAIRREELAAECRMHYGRDVLEAMVNKFLILMSVGSGGSLSPTPRSMRKSINSPGASACPSTNG